MSLQAKLIALLVVLLVGFGSGFGVRAYIASHEKLELQVEDLKADKAEFASYIAKSETQVEKYTALQTKLYQLDISSTRTLNEQEAENTRLAGDLAVARGMRLKGSSCPAAPAGTEAGTTGSVGDGAPVLLSGETGRLVFDLRKDLLRDRAKIVYLHQYLPDRGLTIPPEAQ